MRGTRIATVAITLITAMLLAGPLQAAGAYGDPLVTVAGIDLQAATIPELEAVMASGKLTSHQLTDAYLARIAYFDQGCVKVNAIRMLTRDAIAQADAADRARAAGRTGPLLGIPIMLKDNIDTTDADTTAGSIALAGNKPPRDAFLVSRLRAAGAVILAKANLSEFANWMAEGMPNGFSSLGGQVVNPYTGGDPSGSSSGSGAGGTLAYAAATFGTETSGSVLSPSAANSMVGIKPTVGVVSRSGIIPLAHSYDTAGPIARDVTDAATLLSAVAAVDPADSIFLQAAGGPPANHDYTAALKTTALMGARIGYSQGDVNGLSGDSRAVFQRALDDLTRAGATLVPFNDLGNQGLVGLTELAGIPSEFKYGIADYLAHEAGPAGQGGRPVLLMDNLTGIVAYNQQHASQIPYGQDLLIASDATTGATLDDPTSVATILGARAVVDRAFAQHSITAYVGPNAQYANIGAAANYPSIDVPIGYVGRTPMGIQIMGQAWSESTLIGYAYAYEQASHRRVPATALNPALTSCKPAPQAAPPATGGSPAVLPVTSTPAAPATLIAVLLALLALAVAPRRRRLLGR